jgi:hypothetical protein
MLLHPLTFNKKRISKMRQSAVSQLNKGIRYSEMESVAGQMFYFMGRDCIVPFFMNNSLYV